MNNILGKEASCISDLNFRNRPMHISYKYRAVFQVVRIVLILGMASQKSGSSILKIQIISEALDNEGIMDYLEWAIKNNACEFIQNWRYNPLVSKAVGYSNSERLTSYSKTGKVVLTERGWDLFNEIYGNNEVLIYEKKQLLKIKKKLSDKKLLILLER